MGGREVRVSGERRTPVRGDTTVSATTALVILSEIGTDLSRFPTEKNFVSWLGLCPQHRGSADKIFSRGVRRGANRTARALRLAAQGCHHAKNALGAFYRRIQGRCGGAKAGLSLCTTDHHSLLITHHKTEHGASRWWTDMAPCSPTLTQQTLRGFPAGKHVVEVRSLLSLTSARQGGSHLADGRDGR